MVSSLRTMVFLFGGEVGGAFPLEDAEVFAPFLSLLSLLLQGVEVVVAQGDDLCADGREEFFAGVEGVEVAQLVDIDAVGLFLVLLEELVQDVFADLLFLSFFASEDGLYLAHGLCG
jgi:hypothetical protein